MARTVPWRLCRLTDAVCPLRVLQGFAGHLLQFEAGFAPLSSLCLSITAMHKMKFFDFQKTVESVDLPLPSVYSCVRQ